MFPKAAHYTFITSPGSSRGSPVHNSSKAQPDCNTNTKMTNCQATRLSAEQLAGDSTRKDNSHKFCVAVVVVVPVGTSVVKGVLAVGDSLAKTAVGKSRVVDSLAEGSLRSYKVI